MTNICFNALFSQVHWKLDNNNVLYYTSVSCCRNVSPVITQCFNITRNEAVNSTFNDKKYIY